MFVIFKTSNKDFVSTNIRVFVEVAWIITNWCKFRAKIL